MEDIVQELIEKLASESEKLSPERHYCFCPKCRLDITAIALNQLSPKYVVTSRGETWVRVQQFHTQYEIDVLKAIVTALDIVSCKPQHS